MVSATTGSYQAVTVIALLVAVGLILFFGIMYTQNQSKWMIVDTVAKRLKGPLSSLGLGNPNPGSLTTSASMSVYDVTNAEQFGTYLIQDSQGKPLLVWTSKNGRTQTALSQPVM